MREVCVRQGRVEARRKVVQQFDDLTIALQQANVLNHEQARNSRFRQKRLYNTRNTGPMAGTMTKRTKKSRLRKL